MSITPAQRPQQERAASVRMLETHGVRDQFGLLGIRGYYRDTMGQPGVNDRGLYDDAIFLVTPSAYVSFNANVDPSAFRAGIATLVPGCYLYKLGIHGRSRPLSQRYEALVQAEPVTVTRDGGSRDTGWFGINIHRGGLHGTGSEGCQTVHPSQWPGFIQLVRQELLRHGRGLVPYVLAARA